MKKYLPLFFMAMVIIVGCRTTYPTSEVKYLNSADGTVSLQAVGYANNETKAIDDAEMRALKTLMFKGIPGSTQKDPMVDNPSKTQEEHSDYFTNLFDGRGYKSFLMSSQKVSPLTKDKVKGKYLSVKVKFNLTSLRRDMEDNNVVRKFGF